MSTPEYLAKLHEAFEVLAHAEYMYPKDQRCKCAIPDCDRNYPGPREVAWAEGFVEASEFLLPERGPRLAGELKDFIENYRQSLER